jgi:putative intracellular protease/amidase
VSNPRPKRCAIVAANAVSAAPVVAVLVADGFDEQQFCQGVKVFQQAGWDVRVVAPRTGLVTGALSERAGHSFLIDRSSAAASADDFSALFMPGGSSSVARLAEDQSAAALIAALLAAERAVGAVGASLTLLDQAAPEARDDRPIAIAGRVVAARSPALGRETAERMVDLVGD